MNSCELLLLKIWNLSDEICRLQFGTYDWYEQYLVDKKSTLILNLNDRFFFKTNPEARAEMNIKLYFLIRAHLNQSNERALKAFENG